VRAILATRETHLTAPPRKHANVHSPRDFAAAQRKQDQ
jgi:hypothetical protein